MRCREIGSFFAAVGVALIGQVHSATAQIIKSEFIDTNPSYPQAHASTIVELSDGTVAAAWFGGTGEGYADVAIYFARLNGSGWEKPVAVADGRAPRHTRRPTWNPVLFQDSNGPLHLFYKVGVDPRSWHGMVITSDDGGRQWSAPRALPEGVLGPIKNKPVIAAGSWLSPSSREIGTFKKNRWLIRMERSSDHGRTWHVGAPIASPAGLEAIQPSVLTLANKRLALVARTRQGVLAASYSQDNGVNWSPLVALALPNPNAGTDAVTLADGRQLLVYNHSAHAPDQPGYGPRWPLNIALSDDAVHWRTALTLESAPLPEGYAYPAVIQTRDGLIHITYTYDRRRIRHVVVDPKLLNAPASRP